MPSLLSYFRYVLKDPNLGRASKPGSSHAVSEDLTQTYADISQRMEQLAQDARREVLKAGFRGHSFSDIASEARYLADLSAEAQRHLQSLSPGGEAPCRPAAQKPAPAKAVTKRVA